MKKKVDFGSIIRKEKLIFKNQNDLEKYYFKKYKEDGGYKKGGFKRFGINISNIYHKGRIGLSLKMLDPNKNEIILDAGCGIGELTKKIARNCKKVIGVDVAKTALSIAKKKSFENCSFEYGNIEKLRFSNRFFDKIICVETLEHLINPSKALREFNRLLKSNGKLVLCVPTLDNTLIVKFEKLFGIAELWPISEHLNEWDFTGVKDITEKQGFKLMRTKGLVFDFGIFMNLFNKTKITYFPMLKLSLLITCFPRNSSWVIMEFEKIK